MKVSEFDYYLPKHLIAQDPMEPRDASRLLVLKLDGSGTEHRRFRDLPEYLSAGDCLVLNDTRVFRARLLGERETGGKAEVFLLRRLEDEVWEALVRPGRRLRTGAVVVFGGGVLRAEILDSTGYGGRLVRLSSPGGDVGAAIDSVGHVPVPPYIHSEPEDPERYQTVYSEKIGSVAAPTAGLHFTPQLLSRLKKMGVVIAKITLHIGLGTFRPVEVDEVEDHRMHAEFYTVSEETAREVNEARRAGRRVVAVGTTVTRVLETTCDSAGRVTAGSGWTDLYIYPGHEFKAISALITNFHLPRSTLLMLVCAFGGRERVLEAYREAVEMGYRFYSFGDAMLLI